MKIKKRDLKYAFIIIIIFLSAYFCYRYINKDPYSFEGDKFSYSANRGSSDYSMSLNQINETFDVFNINFKSKNFLENPTMIYGLLFLPKSDNNVPGLVLLPGGGVSKEAETGTAVKIAQLGYAVLTIDQRGIGQTGGYYLGYEQDYQVFSQGKEPIQHLSVYDALKSFDILRNIKGVDKENIAIMGESMGARYAIIAAALDKRIKGVITISTSGFHVKKDSSDQTNNYYLSIDPDNYISDISPRQIFMFHGTNDTMVKPESAKQTFDLAKEPKQFFTADGCGHGYCDKMYDDLKESLAKIFKI